MITLITGLPGNGKTLFALTWVKNKAEREGREVFYQGIKDLTLPWKEIKGEDWKQCPPGSIIVIDEAQKLWPARPNGAALPAYYSDLAEHRHQGFDFVILTQGPKLIAMFVRELVGQHFHCRRKFGMARSTIYEWDKVNMSPMDVSQQKSAVPMSWKFNKKAYEWYTSAEVHTVKVRFPMKFVIVGLMVVGICTAMYLWVDGFGKSDSDPSATAPVITASNPMVQGSPAGAAGGAAPFDPVADAREYMAKNTPRIAGLPHTAPKYDQLTVPKRVPIPAACIIVGEPGVSEKVTCKCYTQQATPMGVEFGMCVEFARNGFFRDFDADNDQQRQQTTARGVAAIDHRPDVPIRSESLSGAVVAFAEPASSGGRGANPAPDLNDGPPRERASRTVIAE